MKLRTQTRLGLTVVVLAGALLAGSAGWDVLSGQAVSVTGREVGLVVLAAMLAAGVHHALTLPDDAASGATGRPGETDPAGDSEPTSPTS